MRVRSNASNSNTWSDDRLASVRAREQCFEQHPCEVCGEGEGEGQGEGEDEGQGEGEV